MTIDIMSCNVNTIERIMERLIRVEYGTVIRNDTKGVAGVQCRDDPNGDLWNTVTVRIRNTKTRLEKESTPSGMTGTPDKVYHYYCLVLQGYNQKWAGEPYTPRIGDMVAVLFVHNQKPIVLGTVVTNTQDPVCRAPFNKYDADIKDARYDYVKKWCQFIMPIFTENEEVKVHYPGKHPICEKIFHKTRDQIHASDCREGNNSACEMCKEMDHIKRTGNQWEKKYSSDTTSYDLEHPYIPHQIKYAKNRHEFHEPSGSYLIFQNNPSSDLDFGSGLVRIENATSENSMKGHLNMNPRGTIDVHTKHCHEVYSDESSGTRMSVVSLEDDTVDHSFEAIDFSTNSLMEIKKNGDIVLSSTSGMSEISVSGNSNQVTINGNDVISETARQEIYLDAPLVHITGDVQIDGTCTHTACNCGIINEGWI